MLKEVCLFDNSTVSNSFFLIKFVQPELSCYILITIVQLCFPIDLMGEREGGDEEHMPTTHSFPETYNYET